MRRVALNSTQPLRVTNRQESDGVDSMSSGAPPPCYSSQKETASSVATLSGAEDMNRGQDDDHDDSVYPKMGPHELLPSPYSTEDLLSGAGPRGCEYMLPPPAPSSTDTQSCVHGYTHTHSQCTFDLPPACATYDTHRTPTVRSDQFPNRYTASHSSVHHGGHGRYSSTPTTPSSSRRGFGNYRTHLSILQRAATGHLTYHPHEMNYEDEGVANEAEQVSHSRIPMGSTVNFLPEDNNSRRQSRHATLHENSSARMPGPRRDTLYPTNSTAPTLPAEARATNFVSLSRKSTHRGSRFPVFLSNRKAMSSSITGTFSIDPRLNIPSGLIKAVEPQSLSSSERSPTSPSTLPKQSGKTHRNFDELQMRRKNLALEVENGGIDVDVHLVSSMKRSSSISNRLSTSIAGAGKHNFQDSTEPEQEPTRKSLDNRCLTGGRHTRQSLSIRQSVRHSDSSVQKVSSPTLIDLRLKETKADCRSRLKRTKFPLAARINAPNPRPPFHLLASTIEIPLSSLDTKSSDPSPDTPNPPTTLTSKQSSPGTGRTRLKSRSHSRTSPRAASKSPLTLHLPRTFHGPLTVHITAGNIDAHVRLSKELGDAAVVLSETACSRGYFVGGLSSFNDSADLAEGWEMVEEEEGQEHERGVSPDAAFARHCPDLAPRASSRRADAREARGEFEDLDGVRVAPSSEIHGQGKVMTIHANEEVHGDIERQDEEWHGDKVDLIVGDGKVYLQYLGEEDPFGRQGRFWNTFGFGCR